jgi:hypothetical protein
MNRIFTIIASILLLSFTIPAVSQEKADKQKPDKDKQQTADSNKDDKSIKDPSKLWVDLSCLIYLGWGYRTGFNYTGASNGFNDSGYQTWGKVPRWGIDDSSFPTLVGAPPLNYSYKNNNTFQLERAYITIKKQIGEIFSAKITTDIDPNSSDYLYLKYGFVQLYKEFGTPVGPISLKAQLGKIATPVVGITDKLNDLRWLGRNYIENSKMVLNGNSFDNSADLGGMVSLSLLKLMTLEYSLTNGEGVKSDHNETYAGKSHTLLVSVNPIDYLKELYVNFYGRWEDTNKNKIVTGTGGMPTKYQGTDERKYMGCGIAWYSDLVKAGMNFILPVMHYSKTIFISPITGYSPRHQDKFMLIDSWLNINIGAIAPTAPVLFVGRCAWGREHKSLLSNGRQAHETIVLGAGAGYQFSEYFRLVLYYEAIRYHVDYALHDVTRKDPTPNNNVYIKTEIKF